MSFSSLRHMRKCLLAGATALAIAGLAMTSHAAEIDLAALDAGTQDTFDRFIVKYRAGSQQVVESAVMPRTLARASRALSSKQGRTLNLRNLHRIATGANVIEADRALDRVEAASLMRQLASDPDVEYVEVDQRLVPLQVPNDRDYQKQWNFHGEAGGIRAESAWDKTQGEGVVVAVVDTGITRHSDLDANVLPGYDFMSSATMANDGDGRDRDPGDRGDSVYAGQCGTGSTARHSSWHGTHVAGTIAAVTDNGKGVAGTAYKARIVPVRALGKCGGYMSDIADGIIWASGGRVSGVPRNANPAEVINLSLGSALPVACSYTSRNAIASATGRGSIVVVAAGNFDGDVLNENGVGYNMANCGNVIVVGANDSKGARASFSNHGSGVDVSAPGVSILSTTNDGLSGPGSEDYGQKNGTSMSSPHVAGVVALVQSVVDQPLTTSKMRSLLRSTARDFPTHPSKPIGTGIVDADAALASVLANGGGDGGDDDVVDNTRKTYDNTSNYNIPDNSYATSPITVSGRSGRVQGTANVWVDVRHTREGDLTVDLIAPDGSRYRLRDREGGWNINIRKTFSISLPTENLQGTWKLKVSDHQSGQIGYIRNWSITF